MNRKNSIIKPLSKLNPNDFKSKLILDNDLKLSKLHRPRIATFQCTKCNANFTNMVYMEKQKKSGICKNCFVSPNFIFTKLEPDAYKAKLIFDIEYELRKRKTPRQAIFECQQCQTHFIQSIGLAHMDTTGSCQHCLNPDLKRTKRNKRNTSGYTGVQQAKINSRTRFKAHISVNYIEVYLGSYKSPQQAAIAYDQYITDNNLSHPKNFKD